MKYEKKSFAHDLYNHVDLGLLTDLEREAASSSKAAEPQWYSPEKRKINKLFGTKHCQGVDVISGFSESG
jgi:hypothetical protein